MVVVVVGKNPQKSNIFKFVKQCEAVRRPKSRHIFQSLHGLFFFQEKGKRKMQAMGS